MHYHYSVLHNPNSRNVGIFFIFFFGGGGGGIKTKTYREHNKCLNRELLHIYPLNQLISNVIPATGLKKVVSGQQRAEKMTF